MILSLSCFFSSKFIMVELNIDQYNSFEKQNKAKFMGKLNKLHEGLEG